MRFESIGLPAYGPFTEEALDLTGGRHKLELIYGPNEAGKSSLLRAISDFLFGIPAQTSDNFIHPYGNLRIRAEIESGGERLECVRRKANSKSLRRADNEEPVPEDRFRRFFPIDNRELFEAMFGLDSERLKKGGEELLKGHSEFGQLLFSAAAGIEGLHDILKGLNDEADKTVKPKVRELVKRLDQSKDRLRDTLVSLTTLKQLQDQHESAVEAIAGIEAEVFEKRAELGRLKRIEMSVGLLQKRALAREELIAVKDARILRHDFASEYQKVASDLVIKNNQAADATARVKALKDAMAEIILSGLLLDRGKEILAVYEETGLQRKAASDKLKRQGELQQAELKMSQILRTLGEPQDLARVPDLIVKAADKRLLQDLSNSRANLDAENRNGLESVSDGKRSLGVWREQFAVLPETRSVTSLRAGVQKASLAEVSETKANSLQRTAVAERQKIRESVIALPWPSSVETLENSALPSEQLVAEWTGRLDKAEQSFDLVGDRLREARGEVLGLEHQLASLAAGRAVPALSKLAEDRRRRDLGWAAVRSTWLDGSIDNAEARSLFSQLPDDLSLATAYEESVASADGTADILRIEADQVAKLEQMRVAIEGARKDAAARQTELEEEQGKRAQLEAAWQELWTPFELAAQAPRQMADWLQRRGKIIDRLRAVVQSETEAERLLGEAEAARREVRNCVAEITDAGSPASDTLSAWRSVAEQIVQAQERLATQREELRKAIETGERTLGTAEGRVNAVRISLEDWGQKWTGLMSNLGLAAATEPAAAQEIIQVRDDLQSSWTEAEGYRTRIAGIERDATKFRETLRKLLEAVALDLASSPELEAVGELNHRLSVAQQQKTIRDRKEQDLAHEQQTLEQVERKRRDAESLLQALMAEARCARAEDLAGMIQDSTRRKDLEKRLQDVEEQLVTIGAGNSISELENEARGVVPDQIPGCIEQVERTLDELQVRLKSAVENRITVSNKLKWMEENSDSCSASADIEADKAEVLEAARHYIRLQLARTVLQGAVERYREKTQGEMLEHSSHLFSVLTGGSFSGLKLDWDDSGKLIVVGSRASTGKSVSLNGMSEGTGDQLYLALRLASMELYARDHEPIPFVLDDVLIKFDDTRAAAAIRALAELAQHTQVLLFTHHRHLVDLANASLDPAQLAVFEIGRDMGYEAAMSA